LLHFLLFTLSASAADNRLAPWLGTWEAKYKNTAAYTMVYSELSNGKMRESNGDDSYSYDFAINREPYEYYFGTTITWTAASGGSWDSVISARGREYYKVHRELSANAQILTVTWVGTDPDGSSRNMQLAWLRISGTTGLVGEWRCLNGSYMPYGSSLVISSPQSDIMRWGYPGMKGSCEGKPDGSDLACAGPYYPPGFTVSYTLLSDGSFSYVYKRNGKPIGYGIQTLAADGKSLTDVSWLPGRESEKTSQIFVKQ
jgi:hypothetical protein